MGTHDNEVSSPYWRWLRDSAPTSKKLHWCHSTDAYRLRDIIDSGVIHPTKCQVFAEDLVYFFYGRPAYRRQEQQQLRISAKSPVIIVLAPTIEELGTRVFPFDSGAFDTRYESWKHADMPVMDFVLPCKFGAPQRHVSEFFGSNSNYLKMSPQRPTRNFTGEFEVEVVSELIQDRSSAPADDRRLAVELQVGVAVPFAAPVVVGLIVPDIIREALWFTAWEKSGAGQAVDIRTYNFVPLRNAAHYQVAIESSCLDLAGEVE